MLAFRHTDNMVSCDTLSHSSLGLPWRTRNPRIRGIMISYNSAYALRLLSRLTASNSWVSCSISVGMFTVIALVIVHAGAYLVEIRGV